MAEDFKKNRKIQIQIKVSWKPKWEKTINGSEKPAFEALHEPSKYFLYQTWASKRIFKVQAF